MFFLALCEAFIDAIFKATLKSPQKDIQMLSGFSPGFSLLGVCGGERMRSKNLRERLGTTTVSGYKWWHKFAELAEVSRQDTVEESTQG